MVVDCNAKNPKAGPKGGGKNPKAGGKGGRKNPKAGGKGKGGGAKNPKAGGKGGSAKNPGAGGKGEMQNSRCAVSSTLLSIAFDPAFQVPIQADFYSCATTKDAPLLIITPGAFIPKTEYSMTAETIAHNGEYSVMVLEHNLPFGARGAPANFATPVDIQSAVAYAQDNAESLGLDAERIVLVGHSFGGSSVLFFMNGICPPPLCGSAPVFFPSDTSPIKAVVNFGHTLTIIDQQGQIVAYDDELKNYGFPYAFVNGAGDFVNSVELEGGLIIDGSFERVLPAAAFGSIENADHYSICNSFPADSLRPDAKSTAVREDQVQGVVDALDFWITETIQGINAGACDNFVGLGKNPTSSFAVARCKLVLE